MATFQSAVIFPFAPGRPYLWELTLVLAGPSIVVHFLLRRHERTDFYERLKDSRWLLIGALMYCVVLVVTMYYRGVGLRVLGATAAGGRAYLQQILTCVWLGLCIVASTDERGFTRNFLLYLAMPMTYLASELAFTVAPGQFWFLLQFFELSADMVNFEIQSQQFGLRRYQSFAFAAPALLYLLVILHRPRHFYGARALYLWPVGTVLGLAGLMSGHRAVLLVMLLVLLLYGWVSRMFVLRNVVVAMGAALLLLVPVYAYARHLPLAAQRALSILPGISVDGWALSDARSTYHLRWELNRLGWQMLPDYFWVGRGFTRYLDVSSLQTARRDTLEYHLQEGQFYNGFIGQMVTTGAFGTLAVGLFCLGGLLTTRRLILWIRRQSMDDLFTRICALIACMFAVRLLFFFFVNGYSAYTTTTLAPLAGMQLLCWRLVRQREARLAAEASVVPEAPGERPALPPAWGGQPATA